MIASIPKEVIVLVYKTLYEAKQSYGISPIFIIVCILSALIIVLVFSVWKKQSLGSKVGLGIVVVGLLMILFGVTYSYINSKMLVYDKYANGENTVIEGVVEDYVENTDNPPADLFEVNNTLFYVPGLATIWGYPFRACDGGVLKNGEHVRITYISYQSENVIMKLELAKTNY
jgi:hypothetical protein